MKSFLFSLLILLTQASFSQSSSIKLTDLLYISSNNQYSKISSRVESMGGVYVALEQGGGGSNVACWTFSFFSGRVLLRKFISGSVEGSVCYQSGEKGLVTYWEPILSPYLSKTMYDDKKGCDVIAYEVNNFGTDKYQVVIMLFNEKKDYRMYISVI